MSDRQRLAWRRVHRINIAKPSSSTTPTTPRAFAAAWPARAGARREQTGTSVYELPPGQALCPYHYEHAEEEWLLVLEGSPTLREPEGEAELEPWDLVFFTTGPRGRHGLRNETDEPVRVLMYSTVMYPAVTVYPDSDKIGRLDRRQGRRR